MALCYRIPYSDRFGEHQATKWADTPAAAIALHRKAREISGIGGTDYGTPTLVLPQPFERPLAEIRVPSV